VNAQFDDVEAVFVLWEHLLEEERAVDQGEQLDLQRAYQKQGQTRRSGRAEPAFRGRRPNGQSEGGGASKVAQDLCKCV